ncbi:peptidase domain-containing ABC transporter [Burkholderia gladioli]|uniref:peptidase domain-containing ABC transporter n=1 Tax=Burkholderia gladioli TaxID=28095 RepID=UPI001C26B0FA|nr:peptidase domain-containing ABC transporter [Burkholderia gladioli]MBU9378497.1 peptidase domain-containing ABC transporter [Burkholderia gladioli]
MNFLSLPDLRFWNRRTLPAMLQTEATECGLTCIAMVASYWGNHIDLRAMRNRFSVSLKGATLKSLVTMAVALKLRARPLRTSVRQLQSVPLPCVLHWDMNHFVVLSRIRGEIAEINDPAVGVRRLSLAEIATHYTGIALELTPESSFVRQDAREPITLAALVGRIVGLRGRIAGLASLGIAMQLLTMIAPFYLQWVVDQVLVADDANLLDVLALAFLVLAMVQAMCFAVRSWFTTTLSTDINFQWFRNVFDHLMKLPVEFFEKRHVGDIVSRFGAVQVIQRSLTNQSVDAAIDGILVIGSLVVMALYSLGLASITLVAMLIYCAVRASMFRALKARTREQIVFNAKQQTHFIESVRGAQTIRLFNGALERKTVWSNLLADQVNAELGVARLTLWSSTASNLIFNIEKVLIVWLGARLVLGHSFSVGMLLAFLAYKEQFTLRVSGLIDKLFEFRMLRIQAERLADIVMSAPEDDEHADEIDGELDLEHAGIELRGVSFRYAADEPDVLEKIDLTIRAGECLALTGPSGSGKTTLVKLLLGVLSPTEGRILIGGRDLRHLGLARYRALIGTVMQDDQLFAGSVADNIAFFDVNPDRERIESCARAAAIHREIRGMPMGYASLIGDIGSGMSGGQRQRLLLARALYRKPRILVLDEATSALDADNEAHVNQSVAGLGLTRILVAHRAETIAMAERVVTLAGGRIVSDQPNSPVRASDSPASAAQCEALTASEDA